MKLKIKSVISRFFSHKGINSNYDFYPNHIAIIKKPPTPYSHYIAITLSLSVIIFIVWAYLGKLDVQASATGRLIITGYSQHIQAYEQSRLTQIHVKNGQYVKQGTPLLTLDILGIDEEIKSIKNKLNHLMILKIRYQALSQDSPLESLYQFNKLDNKIRKSILVSYKKEKNEFISNVNNINIEIEINNKNKMSIINNLTSLNKLKKNIDERLEIKSILLNKKVISRMEYLENEKELLDITRQINLKQSELILMTSKKNLLTESLDKLIKQKSLEWHDKYKQYESEILILNQTLSHLEKRQQLKVIRSPVTGTVQQLTTHTLGGVLQPAQSVMVIVPDTNKNIAEVNVLNKDIAFIYKDQKAIIKIDAYPYTRYGTIEGKVINIAKDSVQHEQLGLVYPTLIELNTQFINMKGHEYKLTTGMSLIAEIIIDKRRVIDYILSPIEVYRHEALREK